jgi:hypothetical protein
MTDQYEDISLDCSDCHQPFTFTKGEQAFFAEKQLTPPKRCKPCRQKRKEAKEGNGGGTYSAGSGYAPSYPEAPADDFRSGGGGKKRRGGSRRSRDTDY